MDRFLRRFSRSDKFAEGNEEPRVFGGTSDIFEYPSHVFVFPLIDSAVAFPTFESVAPSSSVIILILSDDLFSVFPPKKLENPPKLRVSLLLELVGFAPSKLVERSLSSFSKLSKSFISMVVVLLEFFALSFINNSIPVP